MTKQEIRLSDVPVHCMSAAELNALLESGADPDDHSIGGWSALHTATSFNADSSLPSSDPHEIVRLLLESGANINRQTKSSGFSPLHLAAKNGKSGCARVLLEFGAQVNIRDGHGKTPLQHACFNTNKDMLDMVRMLLDYGADPDIPDAISHVGMTCLHIAVLYSRMELAELLLSRGASLDIKNAQGKTARSIASENGENKELFEAMFRRSELNKVAQSNTPGSSSSSRQLRI